MSVKSFINILDKVTLGAAKSFNWELVLTSLSVPASILLNRTLGAQNRGLLAIVVLVPSTLFTLGSCQWSRLVKGLITSKKISGREAWHHTIYYSYVLSLIFIPIAFIFIANFTQIPQNYRWLSLLYCLAFPVYFITGAMSSIYISIGNINAKYLINLSASIIYLIIIIILLLCQLMSVTTIIATYIITKLISLVLVFFTRTQLIEEKVITTKPSIAPLVKGFIPYTLESLSNQIDIWAFSFFGSLVNLGTYTAINGMMLPVNLIANALTNGSTANLDWTQPKLVRMYLYKTVIILLSLLIIISLLGIGIGPYLLVKILGNSFHDGEWMFPWIAAVVVSQLTSFQFHNALLLSGLENSYLLIQTVEPLFRFVIVIFLGWSFSVFGIMLGMILSSFVKSVICWWLYNYYQN